MKKGDLIYLDAEFNNFGINNEEDKQFLPCVAIVTSDEKGQGFYDFIMVTNDGCLIKSCGHIDGFAKKLNIIRKNERLIKTQEAEGSKENYNLYASAFGHDKALLLTKIEEMKKNMRLVYELLRNALSVVDNMINKEREIIY